MSTEDPLSVLLHEFADRIRRRLAADAARSGVTVQVHVLDAVDEAHLARLMEELHPTTYCSVVSVGAEELGEDPIPRLRTLLDEVDLPPAFIGFAPRSVESDDRQHVVAVLCPEITSLLDTAPVSFRATAIVTAFNESDVIRPTVTYLLDQGIDVVVIDNWSTDDTIDQIRDLTVAGRIRVLEFPPDGPTGLFELERMLEFVAETASGLEADWIIHHDADQRHDSPWPGLSYRDALYSVHRMGFTAVDHTVIDFRPVDNTFRPGTDLGEHFRHFEFHRGASTTVHVQAWRNQQRVDLAKSGGHEVQFPDRLVFPFNFTLRHYQIRSQAHGEKKVFHDRRPRYRMEELDRGWHNHYFNLRRRHDFLRNPGELNVYDPESFDETFLLERLAQLGMEEAVVEPARFGGAKDASVQFLRRLELLDPAFRARNRLLRKWRR